MEKFVMNGLRNLSLSTRIHLLNGTVLLLFLLVFGWILLQFRAGLNEERRKEVRHLVESGWHILDSHVQQVETGVFSSEKARRHALQLLRNQPYEEGTYLWLSDLSGAILMHPHENELEGRELSNLQDIFGRPLFRELVEVVGNTGHGFFEYLWPKPGGTKPVAKVSFVKEFPEWGWVIGAGYYRSDIDRDVFGMIGLASIVLIPAAFAATLLQTYLARSIAIPMKKAVKMIEALEGGFLGHRMRLNQQDEVGRMARSMDAFADNLQHEILTAFEYLARGDFSFEAKGLIKAPLARTNERLNALVARLDSTVVEAVEARTRTEALIAAIGEGVAILNPGLKFTYQNSIHIDLVGSHLDKPCSYAYPDCGNACAKCALALSLADGQIHRMDRVIRSNDRDILLEITVSPVRDIAGSIVSIVEIARDVTDRKQAETALIESEARYFSLFLNNHAVMLVLNPATASIVEANPSACVFYGYTPEQIRGMKLSEINTLSAEEIDRKIEKARIEGRWHFHARHRLATGEVRDVEIFSGPVRLQGEELLYAIVYDVTERKRAEEWVEYLAFHDPLTGLANRALLEDRLTQMLPHALRYNKHGALLSIDLDRFKTVNDSLGHHAGDLLLKKVGHTLKDMVRATDTVCRSGGDEFLVLLPEIASPTDAASLAEKILDTFKGPLVIEGHEIFITPSIGVSLYPGDGADFLTMIRNAEAAMYSAKKQGRNNFQFFKSELMAAAQERLQLESNLRRALEKEELQLHYQPQFDAATGELVGVEALLRWYHPPQGWIPPGEFIPVAEESGLIEQLGAWVLRAACEQNRRWQQSGFAPIRMAVNVSGRQFRQSNFLEVVDRILEESGLDPRWLEVEVTENIVMENVGETIMTLKELKDRHISLAIDDFGTGYSSLSYLRQFPIDRLKIDRSFVAHVTTNADDAAIASAIISLAGTLNLEVVAEGVETAEQALFLSERQCDAMQGYYFGRPVPPEKLTRLLNPGRSVCAG